MWLQMYVHTFIFQKFSVLSANFGPQALQQLLRPYGAHVLFPFPGYYKALAPTVPWILDWSKRYSKDYYAIKSNGAYSSQSTPRVVELTTIISWVFTQAINIQAFQAYWIDVDFWCQNDISPWLIKIKKLRSTGVLYKAQNKHTQCFCASSVCCYEQLIVGNGLVVMFEHLCFNIEDDLFCDILGLVAYTLQFADNGEYI